MRVSRVYPAKRYSNLISTEEDLVLDSDDFASGRKINENISGPDFGFGDCEETVEGYREIGYTENRFVSLLEERARQVRELAEQARELGPLGKGAEQLSEELAYYKHVVPAMIEMQNEMISEIEYQREALTAMSAEKAEVESEIATLKAFVVQLIIDNDRKTTSIVAENSDLKTKVGSAMLLKEECVQLQTEVANLRKRCFEQLEQSDAQCMKLMQQVAEMQATLDEVRGQNLKMRLEQERAQPTLYHPTDLVSEDSHQAVGLGEAISSPARVNEDNWDFAANGSETEEAESIADPDWISCGAGLPVVELSADGDISVMRSKLPTVFELGDEASDEDAPSARRALLEEGDR